MFSHNKSTWWFWSTCLVLVSCVLAYPSDHGEKQVNLRIGFDLTQENNGEPALRIRDFADGNYPRALDSSEKKHGHGGHAAIRADSFSDSNEEPKEPVIEVKEVKKAKKSKREREHEKVSKDESNESNSNDDSEEKKIRSTLGIRAGEEGEDGNVKVHGREPDESDAR
ncbi:uncharacterized protein LOC128672628 isoform X1 [Plodia interpunctella]|uniref:uncharacterized protein LOC128672628 isoform X1 n=1 Tax=Plodia interpunctella TaxID=58824 RepID=UPI002367E6EE|nr:uncharacterized protein LOC128672628 isoform X1 [Plodia interpunctella]